MIRDFQYKFEDINVSRTELCSLLGYPENNLPEPFGDLVDEAFMNAPALCNIKGSVFQSDKISFKNEDSVFLIDGVNFNAGKLITKQIKKASSLILFICTAGEGIGRFSQDLLHGDDPVKGYVYDVLGSLTVEGAMDKIQEKLKNEWEESGQNLSNRYSPGYCDWHVSEQHKLFSFFPDKHCGISLNGSSLMHPIKSVSGVIGVGENIRFKKYHCEMCNSTNCIYRNLTNKVG